MNAKRLKWKGKKCIVDFAIRDSYGKEIIVADYETHMSATNNPHSVTKAQVGLGNVENKSVATIKTELTGQIASGNDGFVTGDQVYNSSAVVIANPVMTAAQIENSIELEKIKVGNNFYKITHPTYSKIYKVKLIFENRNSSGSGWEITFYSKKAYTTTSFYEDAGESNGWGFDSNQIISCVDLEDDRNRAICVILHMVVTTYDYYQITGVYFNTADTAISGNTVSLNNMNPDTKYDLTSVTSTLL